MSYNTVLMEMVNEGPHHMSPFMLLIHTFVTQQCRKFGDLRAVELGTNHGNSTISIAAAIAAHGKGHLDTCDLVHFESTQQMIYRSGCAEYVTLHKEDSVLMASRFKDGIVGLLLIDTSHEAEDTKRELDAWAPKVASGGMVLLHDTCSRPEGVGQPAREFVIKTGWPYYNISVDCGLGVMTKP